jgi:glycosyltransferase involved in cell wall biosynthesis
LLDHMQRLQYRSASGLIAVTPQLRHWLIEKTAPKTPPIEVVPNGANINLFRPDAPSTRPLPERYVVFFGGLTAWHGVDTMLSALEASDWPAGVSLVIAGDGPELNRLRSHASASGSRLTLLGRLSYADVPGVVSRSLAGLVPIVNPERRSEMAGLAPLKLFETLACGVPAIVSDFPFQADLVRNAKCGLVVPCDDGPALARAVAELAANPQAAKEMGRRGRDLVCNEHSWDRRATDTAAFLLRLLAKPKHY